MEARRQPNAPMGVRYLDDVLYQGHPSSRCCHGCGLVRGSRWVICVHDDITLWAYSFCYDCHTLWLDWESTQFKPDYADLTPMQQRIVDRIDVWGENYRRWEREVTSR